eukprot:g6198.t2
MDMTRAALHFATCAKKVQMRPQINRVVDSKAQLKQLMEETRLLKKQLEAFKSGSNFEALNLELQKKDEEILNTSEIKTKSKIHPLVAFPAHSKNLLKKRLENLEKLVLRAKPGTPKKRRASTNDVCGSPFVLDDVFTPRTMAYDNPVYSTTLSRKSTVVLGSSDNPYASWDGHRISVGNLNDGSRINQGQSHMDWWLPPTVRRRLLQLGEIRSHRISSSGDSQTSVLSSDWQFDGTTFHKEDDFDKEELSVALKSELDEAKDTRSANEAASKALDALEQKIKAILFRKGDSLVLSKSSSSVAKEVSDDLRESHSLPLPEKSDNDRNKSRKAVFFEFSINSEDEKEQKNQMGRLECQKRMLLNQVLKLESKLSCSVSKCKNLEKQLISTKNDLKRVFDSNKQMGASHALSRAACVGLKGDKDSFMQVNSNFGILNRDSWADTPTVESMLPKIVDLWEELLVPLSRRSRFYLAFRGGELFYYEAEHRRLLWEKAQLFPEQNEENEQCSDPRTKAQHDRALKHASKRLDNERRWLAAQLKTEFNTEEREMLFKEWGVPLDVKERKLKLICKLWSRETINSNPEGMERSANFVLQLLGGEDLAANALDLIFRPPSGDDQHIPVPYLISQISRRFSRQSSFLG